MPSSQTSPVSQGLLQPPQCSAEVSVSTHSSPQGIVPLQAIPHSPPEHVAMPPAGTAHDVSQLPQCSESVFRLTHAPSHADSGDVQSVVQLPWSHTSPSSQGLLHPPQWSADAWVSMHSSPHGVASSQVMPHVPELQVAIPPAGTAQDVSHPPQYSGSLSVLTHEPSHSINGSAHEVWHTPALHTSSVPQGLSQPPQ
jgi:hypothetical protein